HHLGPLRPGGPRRGPGRAGAGLRVARPGPRLLQPADHDGPHRPERDEHVHGPAHAPYRIRHHRGGLAELPRRPHPAAHPLPGPPPAPPSWGERVGGGPRHLGSAGWLAVMPGAAIMLVVLAFTLFGDWLRDWLAPRLRQV